MHYEFQTKPYQHQRDALMKGWNNEGFAYLMEQGTGKSKVLLDDIAVNYEMGRITQAAIIPYKGVYAEWVTPDFMQHWPERHEYIVHLWRGMNSAREKRQWQAFLEAKNVFKFFVINVEAFQAGRKAFDAMLEFTECGPTLGAIDESSRIKNIKSVRTKTLLKLANEFDIRRILTGTVAPNDPSDVFAQFEFLGRRLLGHRSVYGFKNEFCVLKDIQVNNRTIPIVVGAKNEFLLKRRMEPWSFRVMKDDCLDLPDKVYVTKSVEVDDGILAQYRSLAENALMFLEDTVVSAQEGITLLLRLHQLTSGFIVDEDKTQHWIHDAKIDACLDLARDTDGKIIFWCGFRLPLRRLVEALRKEFGHESVVEYHGDVSVDQRREAVDGFQSGKVRFFVGTQQAGGMGITLTAANTVVYYSNTFNLEHRLQSEDRAHRIGQTKKVTYYDLSIPGTVDGHIIKALKRKLDIASKIQGDTLKQWISGN